MKIAYILRGLPGSGKSTIAAKLASSNHIFSTDDYFRNSEGIYKFDHTKPGQHHANNQGAFRVVCEEGVDPVVVDNTSTRRWEMEPYIKAARENGYTVVEMLVGDPWDEKYQEECAARNIHGVSLEIVQRMAKRFER